MTLIFSRRVDLDPEKAGLVGQGRRSNAENRVLNYGLGSKPKPDRLGRPGDRNFQHCFNLDFRHGVDLDLGYAGIVGQGRRSKVKVKCSKSHFDITVSCLLSCFARP